MRMNRQRQIDNTMRMNRQRQIDDTMRMKIGGENGDDDDNYDEVDCSTKANNNDNIEDDVEGDDYDDDDVAKIKISD